MEKERLADISLKNITITDKFWNKYRSLVKEVIIPYQWNTLNDNVPDAEPSHCIENFRIAAGEKTGEFAGAVFQDTDVAKWLEAVGYVLESQGRDEGLYRPRKDARHRKGQNHARKSVRSGRAKVAGRLQKRLVQLFDGSMKRQHRKGQQRIHHTQQDSAVCIQHIQRLIDDADPLQEMVDNAFRPKQRIPSIGTNQGVRPERKHKKQYQSRLPLLWRVRYDIGKGIAHKQADHGRLQ